MDMTHSSAYVLDGFLAPSRCTGKKRDAESGNDYFGARYYASSMGRMLSPDPLGPWVADAGDPQSWNMYAYGRNNPLTNIDPTGLDCVNFNSSGGVSGITPTNNTQTLNTQASNCGNNGGNWVDGTVDPNNIVSNGQGGFNVSSSDGTNVYYTTMTAPGQQADGTTCSGNCISGYSQQSLANVDSLIVAGNLNNFMQWLPRNGTPNNPGAQTPLGFPWNKISNNNYCGPNGAGAPSSRNDWACAVHDYNYFKVGATEGLSFLTGTGSAFDNKLQRQADRNLMNNVDNSPAGIVIKSFFGVVSNVSSVVAK